MAWREIASRRVTNVADMQAIVSRTVNAFWRRGMKKEHAREAAAQTLGVTPRRVRSYLTDEVETVSEAEAARIADAWRRSQMASIEALEAEIAAARRNLEQMDTQCEHVSATLFDGRGMRV